MLVCVNIYLGARDHTSQWYGVTVASFPCLHTHLCRLQYEKRGEGLEGFIT